MGSGVVDGIVRALRSSGGVVQLKERRGGVDRRRVSAARPERTAARASIKTVKARNFDGKKMLRCSKNMIFIS
jgi:hypothetical protein